MNIPKRLLSHLEKAGKKFEVVEHRTVYTAYDAAATMKRSLREVVKTLLVKTDKPVHGWRKGYLLACLPADRNIDFAKLEKAINAHVKRITPKAEKVVRIKKVSIPKENVMMKVFKVKPGGLHPFGSLLQVPVFFDADLKKNITIVLPAGSFTKSILMKTKDFLQIEDPVVSRFSVKKKIKKKKAGARSRTRKRS